MERCAPRIFSAEAPVKPRKHHAGALLVSSVLGRERAAGEATLVAICSMREESSVDHKHREHHDRWQRHQSSQERQDVAGVNRVANERIGSFLAERIRYLAAPREKETA